MAMAMAVSCTTASLKCSHHVVEWSTTGAVSSRRRGCSSAKSLLSSASSSSVGGSMAQGLVAFRQQTALRRRDCGARVVSTRCESSEKEDSPEKIPFGYTRKDVILIGVGITVVGVGLKYGLELFGVDSLRAGNVVQITMVAGLTIGWIASYVFRVSNKDMTYAKQLKDYENKVMEKRLEELPEAELETMLAQVEEEKIRLQQRREKKNVT